MLPGGIVYVSRMNTVRNRSVSGNHRIAASGNGRVGIPSLLCLCYTGTIWRIRRVNEFDQAARQAAKIDDAGFLAFIVRQAKALANYLFERWDDTRRKSWEGGPDRTNDLVAILRQRDRPQVQQWLILEFESDPETFMGQRLGVYELLLAMEVSQQLGLRADALIPVTSVVIHLTGHRAIGVRLGVPGSTYRTRVKPLVINLDGIDAVATLAEIAAERLSLCILPWIPLMAGGGEPTLIEEWKRLAEKETDLEKRAQYRLLALTFAELIPAQINWYQALENWNVLQSKPIGVYKREGKLQGIVETTRANLLEVVRGRFEGPVPETIRLTVEGTNDPDILDRWFKITVRATTLADLFKAMKEQP